MLDTTLVFISSTAFRKLSMRASSALQSAFDASRCFSPLLTSLRDDQRSAISLALGTLSVVCGCGLRTCSPCPRKVNGYQSRRQAQCRKPCCRGTTTSAIKEFRYAVSVPMLSVSVLLDRKWLLFSLTAHLWSTLPRKKQPKASHVI